LAWAIKQHCLHFKKKKKEVRKKREREEGRKESIHQPILSAKNEELADPEARVELQ
jgi:hypothetical protein